MNANTIAVASSNTPQVVNSTTETVLVNASGAPLMVGLPSNVREDGHPFSIGLRGKATGGTVAATLIFKVYKGTSATIANDTIVATFSTSGTIPVGGSTFDLSLPFVWDSVSQTLRGSISGRIDGTLQTAAVTGAIAVTDPTTLQFVVSVTFGAANATNSVTLSELTLNQA